MAMSSTSISTSSPSVFSVFGGHLNTLTLPFDAQRKDSQPRSIKACDDLADATASRRR